MNERFYINVKSVMENQGIFDLPRPSLRPTVYVTGWNEWLKIISVESEI